MDHVVDDDEDCGYEQAEIVITPVGQKLGKAQSNMNANQSRSQEFVVNPLAPNLSKVDKLIGNATHDLQLTKNQTTGRSNAKPTAKTILSKEKSYVMTTPDDVNERYVKTEDDDQFSRHLPIKSDFGSNKRKIEQTFGSHIVNSEKLVRRTAAMMGNTPGNFAKMNSHGIQAAVSSFHKPNRGVR